MIVEEVCLRDFRSHENTKVSLTDGVTVIVGENGSGKSTILEAINFALFKGNRRSVLLDDLIRRGASTASVSLVFHVNGRKYRVVRKRALGRAAGSALYEIKAEGEETLIAKGEAEVTHEIERILGMNSEVFTSAVYIRQGEIDALLSIEPSEKKKLIGKLLGAEDLERAYAEMYKVVSEFERRLAELKGVDSEISELRERIKSKRSELEELRNLLRKAARARDEEALALRKLEKMLEAVEEGLRLLQNYRLLEKELAHLRERLERLSHYSARLEAVRERGERYQALDTEITELKEKEKRLSVLKALLNAKRREKEEIERELAGVENHIREVLKATTKALGFSGEPAPEELEKILEGRIGELQEEQSRIKREMEATTREAARLRSRAREAEESLEELLSAQGSCPVCLSPLSGERKEELSREYRRKAEESLRRAEALERKLDEMRSELRYVEKRLAEANRIGGELSGMASKQAERQRLMQRAAELEEEIKKLEDERRLLEPVAQHIAELEREKAELAEAYEEYIEARGYLSRHAGERDTLERKIGEVERELARLGERLKEMERELGHGITEDYISELRRRRDDAQAKLTELERSIAAAEEAVKRVEGEIKELEERAASLEKKLEEKERLEAFVELLRKIRSLFHRDNLQRELRRRALPLIEQYTREVFEEFNLPYSELTLSEDFNVTLFGPLGEESADMLSGGERVALALALRLGIARALSGSALEMIMLDEPTIHLDVQRRQELVEIIKKLSSIPQTIVVTHDKEFEQAADRLLTVEKKAGVSRVVEVS